MSQQIPSLNLTGATVGQTGNIVWAAANQPATLTQVQSGARPYLELVNMSACLVAILTHVGIDSKPLPPGGRDIYPLSQDDTSYSFTVLTTQQNASNNTVFGWYYPANEAPPTIGQTVNQSLALAAPAQGASTTVNATPGTLNVLTITLGPSASAAAFNIASITPSFTATTGTIGVGRPLSLVVSQSPAPTVWFTYLQEQNGAVFFPVNTTIPNSVPGSTVALIRLSTLSGGNFSANTELAVIANIG